MDAVTRPFGRKGPLGGAGGGLRSSWPAAAIARRARRRSLGRRAAAGFTLVEMVVVTAVILVVLGILLPAASTLWEQRKQADAENTLQGQFMLARARALEARGGQTGLFFFLTDDGVQHIVALEQVVGVSEPGDVAPTPSPGLVSRFFEDVFRVTDAKEQTLPAPMRVVPRYVVDADARGARHDARTFSNEELLNNLFDNPPAATGVGQRHRNYFSLVFSPDGLVTAGRDVLIMDRDRNEDGLGDRTGLPVGRGPGVSPRDPYVQRMYPQTGPVRPIDTDGIPPIHGLRDLIGEPGAQPGIALNFPSVDSVLVYDDAQMSRFRSGDPVIDGPVVREYLLKSSQPYYVSRLTGMVIRGPVAEHIQP
jgi:prepilin-type N-terminal cleavage/methylation domain-containing protein